MDDPTIHQRAIDSILAGEHELRRISENTGHELREILMDLAYRWDGRRLEDLRQNDPYAPGNWTTAEWKLFFRSFQPEPSPWDASHTFQKQDYENLLAENKKMKEIISAQKVQWEELANKSPGKDRFNKIQKPNQVPSFCPRLTCLPEYKETVDSLGKLPYPPRPTRFQSGFAETEDLYHHQLMYLYLLANRGMCICMEMDFVVSLMEGISPKTSMVRKVGATLEKEGALESEILHLIKPLLTSIKMVRMTEMAREFCREIDWPVQDSEWEKIIKDKRDEGMQEKNIATLLMMFHARIRGYRVKLPTENRGEISSDLLLVDGNQNQFHTYILLTDSIPEETVKKNEIRERKSGYLCIRSRE
jgi:hypothetical protein